MFKTIKVRLTVIILFILCSVFVIQLSANFLFADNYYMNRKIRIMKKSYQALRLVADKSDKDILDVMGKYEDFYNLQFVLANENLECIYNSKQYTFDLAKNKYKIKANFDFKSKIDRFTTNASPMLKEKKNNKDILILYGILERENGDIFIVIRTPLQEIKEDMYATNRFILYVSGIALILGALLVYFFARKTAKPIEDIDLIALNVTKLDFSKRAKEYKSSDEIGRLATNINRMADKLENTINELKDVNKQLEQDIEYKNKTDTLRKEFIANISHELKTPLSVLGGYTEMLKDNIPGIDKEYYYDVILDEIHNMSNLVTSLLELSSFENGLINMSFEVVNITELVSNVLYNNDILFTNKKLNYDFVSDEHYYVQGNKLYLERVVINYLTNAIRYTSEGGNVKITIKRYNQDIKVTIFNEGNPIPEDEKSLIWERFYRSDKARTRDDGKSLGIGLYFVSSIIDAHNGSYGVDNVEHGVEFWFRLQEFE